MIAEVVIRNSRSEKSEKSTSGATWIPNKPGDWFLFLRCGDGDAELRREAGREVDRAREAEGERGRRLAIFWK